MVKAWDSTSGAEFVAKARVGKIPEHVIRVRRLHGLLMVRAKPGCVLGDVAVGTRL